MNKGENDYLASIGWKEEGTGWYGLGKKDLAILPEHWSDYDLTEIGPRPGDAHPQDLHLEIFTRNGEDMIVGSFTNNTASDISFACFAQAWRYDRPYDSLGKVIGFQPWLKAGETFYFAESVADGEGPYICRVSIREPNDLKYEGCSEELSLGEDGSFTFTVDFEEGASQQIKVPSVVVLFYDENDHLVWVEKHKYDDPGTYIFDGPSFTYAYYRSGFTLGSVQYHYVFGQHTAFLY